MKRKRRTIRFEADEYIPFLTSLSCAMSCVSTTPLSRSQMVHVVSTLEVPMRLGSLSFQSKEVRGAENSLFFVFLFVGSGRKRFNIGKGRYARRSRCGLGSLSFKSKEVRGAENSLFFVFLPKYS
jgi:hypothetical protein